MIQEGYRADADDKRRNGPDRAQRRCRERVQQMAVYSITSSAATTIDVGIESPSFFAVFTLMTS